jgi:hypothetical protein
MYLYLDTIWFVRLPMRGDSMLSLLRLVNKYAFDSETPWVFRQTNRQQADFSPSAIEQSIVEKRSFWLYRSPEIGDNSWSEKISANTLIYVHDWPENFIFMEIRGVRTESGNIDKLMEEIAGLFDIPFASYLPNFEWPWRSMGSILDAALQRDYSWGALDPRFDQPQISLAKSLAATLPRVGMEYYAPDAKFPLFPQRLGWINCWSAEVAEHLGFPDVEKDAHILPLCKRLPSGHWIVQLTEEPLDLRRPEHAEAIVRAYWRFDKIGRRSKPAAKKAVKAKPKPVDTDSLRTYAIHASDASGNWWQADHPPINASTEDEALRIYFCKLSRGRMPRPHETLGRLRITYDALVLEVEGLPPSENVEARLVE